MQLSKYNIISKVKNSDKYFIVNLLHQNADIFSQKEKNEIEHFEKNKNYTSSIISELIEKQYIINEKEEQKIYKNKYLDFIDSRESDEIQIFFVPNYSCNFACTYCYQDDYKVSEKVVSNDIIDSFFQYIQSEFANRKKYVTVFGGEPLMNSPKQKEIITYFVKKANEFKVQLSFVTNGFGLTEYIDILKTAQIREIQITLDGTETVHNNRRFLKNGNGTFSKIVEGIDACLSNSIQVNLRAVVDKENINNLPELAQFAIDKGWTKNEIFKTQMGRNYELHHCNSSPEKLFSRISLYENLFELIQKYPHIQEFYKPSYSISKFLFENGELPEPLFDSCPACKTEWAFDYTGNIYSCTATVGKSDEILGTFYPEKSKKTEIIEEWQSRDVTEIAECKDCSVQLACGGGCGSVAKNRTGKICTTDCRPVKELLELGFAANLED